MEAKLIVCPYCNHEYEDSLDYVDTGDMDGEFPEDCVECGKHFTVNFTTKITFETRK